MPLRSWLRRLALGLGMFPALCLVAPGLAEGAGPSLIYHKNLEFRIPCDIPAVDRPRLSEVELEVSIDQGYHWKNWAQTSADKPIFNFKAPKDGEYWFAVGTIDTKGRHYPSDESTIEPNLKVIVDTTPPTIDLAPMSRRGTRAQVRWEVRDEHIDAKTLVIQFQAPGGEWREVPGYRRRVLDSASWDAGTSEAIRVRAAVYDKAGNLQTASIELPEGIGAAPSSASSDPRDFASPPPVTPIAPASIATEADPFLSSSTASPASSSAVFPAEPPSRSVGRDDPAPRPTAATTPVAGGRSQMMSSPTFSLQYAIDDAGPSGPSRVQLWVTRNNGKTWNFLAEDTDRTSPYEVNLGGEGTFGLTLCVESANGLGDPAPSPGDPPQMWVVVDRTPPQVLLDPVRVGTASQAGRISLSWRSSDDHPGNRPVQISYKSDRPGSRWQPIGSKMEDTGRFDWSVPASIPDRFYLRVEIVDALGNPGFAETPNPVVLDRTRPKARILGLDPAPKPKF